MPDLNYLNSSTIYGGRATQNPQMVNPATGNGNSPLPTNSGVTSEVQTKVAESLKGNPAIGLLGLFVLIVLIMYVMNRWPAGANYGNLSATVYNLAMVTLIAKVGEQMLKVLFMRLPTIPGLTQLFLN